MIRRSLKQESVTLYLAAAVRDAAGVAARPGAVAAARGRILAAGEPADVRRTVGESSIARTIDLTNRLVLPCLVNAHAHLDLTGLGPRTYGGDFTAWLAEVTVGRPTDPDAIATAVHRGIQLSRAAGVEFVGDLAYHPHAIIARQAAGIPGVSYLEVFGHGARQQERLAEMRQRLGELTYETAAPGHARGAVIGISPHAPYSAGPQIFDAASRLSENHAVRVCTHAAETREELAFLYDASGPYVEHLRKYGYTDEDLSQTVSGKHPIDHLEADLRRARWLLAHCNYVEDEHVRLLRRTGTSVVYCPIASDYFGHPPHRYRDMLDAGVNVCLGTDSILCAPDDTEDDCQPLSILAQMRRLFRRDRTDPQTLLRMGTVNGMIGLEFRGDEATLGKGAPALFATVRIDDSDAIDPLEQALSTNHPVEPVRDSEFDTPGARGA
jgi:cytosine/adenosine deaminase-related metal-dependent hydrolase